MSAESDKLGGMVTEFTTLSANLSASLLKIDEKILDLNEQWQAIDYAQDEIESDLQAYVLANKAEWFYTYGNYGVSGTGYLTEWMGFDLQLGLTATLTRISSYEITVDGDQTSLFTVGTSAIALEHGTPYIVSDSATVTASDYNISYVGKTYVAFGDDIIMVNIDYIATEQYANWGPLWDSDSTVQGYMDDWVVLDDFVTGTIGSTTGTYGIQERISNLQFAKSIVQIDKDKYDAMIPIMDTYAT